MIGLDILQLAFKMPVGYILFFCAFSIFSLGFSSLPSCLSQIPYLRSLSFFPSLAYCLCPQLDAIHALRRQCELRPTLESLAADAPPTVRDIARSSINAMAVTASTCAARELNRAES
jgi:hypothetical protein